MKRIIYVLMLSMFAMLIHASWTAAEEGLNIESEAAVLLEGNSGQVLYQKNGDQQMYPASLTKIATAIFVIENFNLEDTVTVSEEAVETIGTKVYLEAGEQVSLKKLVQGMLINSGNDAAAAIAEHVSGSIKNFSVELNKYLKGTVGVENTHFTNPHGLFDEEHYTTAIDLAKITQYALQNDTFKEIFGTKQLEWDGKSWDTTLLTHHLMLKGEIPYEEVTGGKTGFVNESGYTLATSAENEAVDLIVITLNGNNEYVAYEDTGALLDYGLNEFFNQTIQQGTEYITEEKKYTLPEDVVYTVQKDQSVTKKVNDEGMLQIVNEEGTSITSAALKPVEEQSEKNPVSKEKRSHTDISPFYNAIAFLSVFFVFMILAIVYLKKKSHIHS